MRESKDAQTEIAAAQFPKIRVFTVEEKASDKRASDCDGTWVVCDPSSAGDFSAVAYFFAREIFQSQKIPVGLVVAASAGPSKAEDWIPADGMNLDPDLRTLAAGKSGDAEMQKEEYKRRYAEWVVATEKAKADNQPLPPEPTAPGDETKTVSYSTLFNGMIAPLLPVSIRGRSMVPGRGQHGQPATLPQAPPGADPQLAPVVGPGRFPVSFRATARLPAPEIPPRGQRVGGAARGAGHGAQDAEDGDGGGHRHRRK